jgi:hypothetical protein
MDRYFESAAGVVRAAEPGNAVPALQKNKVGPQLDARKLLTLLKITSTPPPPPVRSI